MDPLIEHAWRLYNESADDPNVVRPSIPILFFGDSKRYSCSPIKVVTVALNPSRHEFPVADRFARFPVAANSIRGTRGAPSHEEYVGVLNDYFRQQPYRSWFGWFEEVLQGMEASYYDGQESAALHTDICSPLATDPTWSKLGDQRVRLESSGVALWHRLVQWLEPDVILVSIARRYRDQITFVRPDGWHPFHIVPRKTEGKRPYQADAQWTRLPSGKVTFCVFGPAAQQPFATLDKSSRRGIGEMIKEHLDER